MPIELKLTKILQSGGNECYTLDEVHLLDLSNLPDEYFEEFPHAYLTNRSEPGFRLVLNEDVTFNFVVGNTYDRKLIDSVILDLKQCAKRLKQINQRIEWSRVSWCGTRHITI